MNTIINNNSGLITSIQVGIIQNIPAGDFNPGIYFLVQNITENPYSIEIRPAGQQNFIQTILYPGWNPIIISEIKDAPEGVFQYGY